MSDRAGDRDSWCTRACDDRDADEGRGSHGRTEEAARSKPKQAAQRADYDAPIGPWFDEQPPVKRAPLKTLRAVIEATVPQAQSGLRWSVPFWALDGKHLCDLAVLKHEVALGIFAPPDVFDDPDGQLSGKSDEYRVLKVKDGDEVDVASVKSWLEAAVAAP